MSLLSEHLAKIETDWSKWRFFFCDERLVAFDDPESTYAQYRDNFISNLPITEDQFIKINPQLSGNIRCMLYFMCFFIIALFCSKRGSKRLYSKDVCIFCTL